MRPIFLTIFFTVLAIAYHPARVAAQLCTGSLGEPVINETFGAGTDFKSVGGALSAGVTNLKYQGNACTDDGSYAIVPNVRGCHAGTWQNLLTDHTGDPYGYMMVINASDQPDVFYIEKADGSKLCPNTKYQFAAWILNLIRLTPDTKDFVKPNITFSIETTAGQVLQTYNTSDIPETTDPQWNQYGTFFITPADGSDIIVKLSNNASGSNGNDFILDDITFRPCGPVIETGFGVIGNTADQNQCSDQKSIYKLVASQQGYDNPAYQWQGDVNGQGWHDINGATADTVLQSFSNPKGGVYQYRVGVLSSSNTSANCRTFSDPITININTPAAINVLPDTSMCAGIEFRLQAQGGDTYQWMGPNGYTSSEEDPVLSYNATPAINGTYTVMVSNKGCPSFGSTTVKVFPKVITQVSDNVTICEGGSATLSAAKSTGGLYYKWTPSTGLDHADQATVVASPATTTTYAVRVSNDGCYADNKKVTVTVLKDPVANAGSNKAITEGSSIKLDGTAIGDSVSYFWSPADHLDNANVLTPTASPVDNTTYSLHVLSKAGCGESISTVFVRVFKKIAAPNTFTPNNDGINDYWDIKEIDTYPDCHITVYDRYGQQVFQSNGYPKPWDGKTGGQPLPAGTYYYIIDLKNNLPKQSGWVMIVR